MQGGAHFYELSMHLAAIFSGSIRHENVKIHHPLTFVEHFIEPAFRRLFFPVTIKEYIRRKTRGGMAPAQLLGYFNTRRDVNALSGSHRKILSLITTLYNTPYITLDLVGADPLGGQEVYEIVKGAVKNGGAAVLMENSDEFKSDCTKFIQIEPAAGSTT